MGRLFYDVQPRPPGLFDDGINGVKVRFRNGKIGITTGTRYEYTKHNGDTEHYLEVRMLDAQKHLIWQRSGLEARLETLDEPFGSTKLTGQWDVLEVLGKEVQEDVTQLS